jgi:hypothetical protein
MFNCGMNVFPIFITLLFCGFLFVYFNTRLAQLKNAIEKQNRVLTSFITNIQSDIRGGGNGCGSSGNDNASCDYEDEEEREIKNIVISENNLASDEAVNAVRRFEREKIVVSDDSESEDSDSDNDSDSDSEDSDDEKEDEVLDDIKVIKLQDNIEEVVVAEPLVELINIESNFSVDALLDAAAALASAADATPSYEQMKVDDLRKVVADKGLASKEEVKKLKKPELLVLLKK